MFNPADELAEAARIANVAGPDTFVRSGMPPVIDRTFPNGTSHRILNIVFTSGNSCRPLNVNMNTGEVEIPPEPAVLALQCVAPMSSGAASGRGLRGAGKFIIRQNSKVIWTFEFWNQGVRNRTTRCQIQGKESFISGPCANIERGV